MSTVQTNYGNVSDNMKSTRPRLESHFAYDGGDFEITFEDDERARNVARELAKLLDCSPDDFGYGEQNGQPVNVLLTRTIIECALAIAHLKLAYPLVPVAVPAS